MLPLSILFDSDFDLFEGPNFILIAAIIILIIMVLILFFYSKNKKRSRIKNRNFDSDFEPKYNSTSDLIYEEERIRQNTKPSVLIIEDLKNINRELDNENQELREEIKSLRAQLDKYRISTEPVESTSIKSEINFYEDVNNISTPDRNEFNNPEIEVNQKIPVSFSFEEKNGTIKRDINGDMNLKKSGINYELIYEKEVYGTAIHLEQLQFSYKILNPEKANNKPMRILKNPIYTFNSNSGTGNLIQKGEVQYQ